MSLFISPNSFSLQMKMHLFHKLFSPYTVCFSYLTVFMDS